MDLLLPNVVLQPQEGVLGAGQRTGEQGKRWIVLMWQPEEGGGEQWAGTQAALSPSTWLHQQNTGTFI